jgi:hypothetical protein
MLAFFLWANGHWQFAHYVSIIYMYVYMHIYLYIYISVLSHNIGTPLSKGWPCLTTNPQLDCNFLGPTPRSDYKIFNFFVLQIAFSCGQTVTFDYTVTIGGRWTALFPDPWSDRDFGGR